MLHVGLNLFDAPEQIAAHPLFVRRVHRNIRFVRVIQKREDLVILFLCERIELVVMALGALDGHAQNALANGVDAVEHRLHAELLRVHAAFFIDHRVPQKTSSHQLILRWIRQQVARQLLDDELRIRQVAIERLDHPIAIGPHLPDLIFLIAVGIGIARGIQPVAAPTLAIMRRLQQPVHLLLVGALAFVLQEGVHFRNGGRQADQVQTYAPQQRDAVGFGGWLQTFFV